MEKIFILGNEQTKIWCSSIEADFLTIPTLSLNDHSKIHDFVVNNIGLLNCEPRFIIDLDAADPALALTIAMHIRLSASYISDKALSPIVLVSSLPMVTFLTLGECSQFFLAREGYAFCAPELVASAVYEVKGLSEANFKSDFLDVIRIRPDDTIGRHSLANQWGADVLARVAGLNYTPNKAILKARKTLYFKYILANCAQSGFDIKEANCPLHIDAKGKRVLLIDDEADKGWEDCLRSIFNKCYKEDFDVVNTRISDYQNIPVGIRTKIDNDQYDLSLLDLRLLGDEEDNKIMTKDFSGFRLLEHILKKNRGNQVIIMTASNKAWNLKNLNLKGANGYYIKESPELMLPLEFSIENYKSFKDDVEKAFESKYKRDLYKQIDYLQKRIKKSKRLKLNNIAEELSGILWRSFVPYMIKINSKQDFVAAYLILYSIFELLKNSYKKEIKIKGDGIMTEIIDGIYTQIGKRDSIWSEIEELVNARNYYIHPEKGRKPSKIIFCQDGLMKLFDVVLKIINSLM